MESSSPSSGYEFTSSQDEVLGATARWVRYWAWFAILGGVLMALGGLLALPAGIVNLLIGAVYFFVGLAFKRAAGSLTSVVTTTGSDIDHLMSAMDNLRSAFKVMVILMALGLLGVIAMAVIGAGAVAFG